jgi:hypothetical protein
MAKKKSTGRSAKKNKTRKIIGDDNNGKKNRSNEINKPKKPIPLNDVMTQAETALEMSDLDTALQLFTYASSILTSRVRTSNSTTIDSGGFGTDSADDIENDKILLSSVFGKMGEINATFGNVDIARSNFLDAIELLGPINTATKNDDDDDDDDDDGDNNNNNMALDEEDCNLTYAQSCERIAGLHLYLGQLSSGLDALTSFRVGVKELERAIGILERITTTVAVAAGTASNNVYVTDERDELGSLDNIRQFLIETRRQLCAAYCSIAELYLTDLCDEPDAEASCEAVLTLALALDDVSSNDIVTSDDSHTVPPLPDALQTMANFRLSQSRVPEALVCIMKAYDRMKVGCEAMSALVGLANTTDDDEKGVVEQMDEKSRELVDVDAASSLPEYHFRVQTAKIMLECASLIGDSESDTVENSNQCVESAIQVLGSLLAEDDEVIEVWYLLGCAFLASTPSNMDSAHHYLENALTMLTKLKEDMEESMGDDENDENELDAIECQIIDVKKKLGTYKDEEDESDAVDDEMNEL